MSEATGRSVQKIGRYEIIGQLGKGAMGVVHKATDPTIGRTVALKTTRLDVHGTDAQEMLARFRNEARLAGVLNHPNIVTIYDAGEFEGLFYIAMECIEGHTLRQLLAQRHILPVEEVIDLTRQVCAGLDAAWAHKVVHRDIKPANVMLEADGTAKIMDFGIAKSGGGLTSTGQVLGTPNYMSPEQVRGHALDGRSDLFSMGVILYEMVTGEKPFAGDNVTTIIYKIINEEPTPPRELDVSIHPGLSAVITKALAKSPQQRYQTGAELVKALEGYKSVGRPSASDDPTTRMAADSSSAFGARSATAAATAPALATRPSPPPVPSALTTTVQNSAVATGKVASPLPLLPAIGGIVLLVVLVAAGIIQYVKHSQAQQRAELEGLLNQKQISNQQPAPVPAASSAPSSSAVSGNTPPASATSPSTAPAPVQPTEKRRERPLPNQQVAKPSQTEAAPLPAMVAATGQLVLSTDPSGAVVQIDGRGDPAWHTPFVGGAILPGSHTVTFSLPGYAGETRIVDVIAGRQAFVSAKLAAQVGFADLSSNPVGASIWLDGKDSGKQTPVKLPLEKGTHSVLLRKPGFSDVSTSAHLKPGDTFNYYGTLQPVAHPDSVGGKFKKLFTGKVLVEVRTKPRGAEVMLNGVRQPKSTPLKLSLQAGTYDVNLALSGYKPLHKTVTVEKDVPLEIDEVLEKDQ